MAEYIKRDLLLKVVDKMQEKYRNHGVLRLETLRFFINRVPAADVVKIPCKCAKCKYTEIIVCPITGTEALFCIYGTKPAAVEPTHYCGYGERKEA